MRFAATASACPAARAAKRRGRWWAGLAALALLSACSREADSGAASAPPPEIRIGFVGPLSGPIAHLGRDGERGARLAVEEIDAAGGLSVGATSYRLVLSAEDDKGDPREATLVAQHMVDSPVVAVVGHVNSGSAIPAARIYAEASMAEVSTGATAIKYTQLGYATAFRVLPSDAQQGEALARYAAESLQAKRIVVVDDRTAYGQGLADTVESALAARGVRLVAREFTSDKSSDFNAMITKVRGVRPDLILFAGMDATSAAIAKQLRELGVHAAYLTTDGSCSLQFLTLAGAAAEGTACTDTSGDLAGNELGVRFRQRFQERYREEPQPQAAYGYDAVEVVADALRRAGSTERAAVVGALAATDHEGVLGHIAFDAHGDLRQGAISVYRFERGQRVHVLSYR